MFDGTDQVFFIIDTKFNEKFMQPEILLKSDIEIQNQSMFV